MSEYIRTKKEKIYINEFSNVKIRLELEILIEALNDQTDK